MSGKQVPDRMLAHAARAKGTCDDFFRVPGALVLSRDERT